MENRKTPTSAIVFGILNFVLTAFGACATIGGIAQIAIGSADRRSPFAEMFQELPGYQTVVLVGIGTSAITSLLLLVSGVGLVMGKPWGRAVALTYCVLNVLFTLAVTALMVVTFNLPMAEKIQGKADAEVALTMMWGFTGGTCLGGMLYPLILGIFMLKLKLPGQVREY